MHSHTPAHTYIHPLTNVYTSTHLQMCTHPPTFNFKCTHSGLTGQLAKAVNLKWPLLALTACCLHHDSVQHDGVQHDGVEHTAMHGLYVWLDVSLRVLVDQQQQGQGGEQQVRGEQHIRGEQAEGRQRGGEQLQQGLLYNDDGAGDDTAAMATLVRGGVVRTLHMCICVCLFVFCVCLCVYMCVFKQYVSCNTHTRTPPDTTPTQVTQHCTSPTTITTLSRGIHLFLPSSPLCPWLLCLTYIHQHRIQAAYAACEDTIAALEDMVNTWSTGQSTGQSTRQSTRQSTDGAAVDDGQGVAGEGENGAHAAEGEGATTTTAETGAAATSSSAAAPQTGFGSATTTPATNTPPPQPIKWVLHLIAATLQANLQCTTHDTARQQQLLRCAVMLQERGWLVGLRGGVDARPYRCGCVCGRVYRGCEYE